MTHLSEPQKRWLARHKQGILITFAVVWALATLVLQALQLGALN